ncbi:MAG: hypothetical protein AAB834_04955, partial [Patescibacteria group bacterium]
LHTWQLRVHLHQQNEFPSYYYKIVSIEYNTSPAFLLEPYFRSISPAVINAGMCFFAHAQPLTVD